MARYLLDEVCPEVLAGTNVTCTKVVIWETDEAFAAATLDLPDRDGAFHENFTAVDSARD
jgi:6-pyruvoyltetrahydropterin/6-carboxytetrahydropterin synthase